MKAKFIIAIFISVICCLATNTFAQTSGIPAGISYQAVARDADGFELTNKSIAVRISLIRGSTDGNTDWIETHSVTTDKFGLFNFIIGEGTRETGSTVDKFSDLSWGSDRYFLKVDIDFGTGYRSLDIMPLLSVPYALYAATSGSSKSLDNQSLHFDSLTHRLCIDRGDSVDLSSLVKSDISKSYISNIDLNGNILSITKNEQVQSIDLSQLNQQISFDTIHNQLTLSDGGTVSLAGFVKNSETSRFYISSMLLSGDSLVIYQGGVKKTIDLSHFNRQSTSYQYLTLTNNLLKLSQDTTTIDLSKYLDNTNQQISFDSINNRIILSNGGIINLPNFIKNSETLKFYISNLILSGDSLVIYQVGNRKVIDLSHFNKPQVYQNLSLSGNILKLSNDTSLVDLSKYLDNTNQQISFDSINNRIILSNGGIVILPNFVKNSETLKFYISNLLLSGDSLVISQAGNRKVIDLSHFDKPQIYQNLSLSGNILRLSNDTTKVDLSKYLDNKNQQLSLAGDSLKLSNADGGVELSKYNKFLTLVGNALFLTNTPNYSAVDLTPYQDDYHIQWDNNRNSYALKDSKGNTNGDLIIPQDLRTANDRLWITGNQDSTIVDLRKYVQQITLDKDSNKLYVTNGSGVSSFTINQSLQLNDSILSLSKDPSNKKINLNFFDNQWLHVYSNKLTIDNGNSVYLDTDTANEIQSLVLKNDSLFLTKDPFKTRIPFDKQKLYVLSNNRISIDRGDTIAIDTDPTNEIQSLALINDTLSLTKDPSLTKVPLVSYDKQKLHVLSNNKLSIDRGDTVGIDTDPSNEIQSLVLINDTLSLSKDPTLTKLPLVSYDKQKLHLTGNNHLVLDRGDSVDLSKYLDNTDTQKLSFSNGQISLTNGGTVNVREKLYAFRAVLNNSAILIPDNTTTTTIVFSDTLMNYWGIYNNTTGVFTCPLDGSGLYQFTISFNYEGVANHMFQLLVIKNGIIQETLQNFNTYSFIYYMKASDQLYIRLSDLTVLSGSFSIPNCSFMGYRINQ